jgi:hypothetical protein
MRAIYWAFYFFAGMAVLVLSGCNGATDAAQNRFETIASAYCECTAQLVVINKEADAADRDHLGAYFQKMQTEYYKVKDCTATIIGQFGHLNPAELDSVNMFLKTKCPDLADKREQLQELLGE